MIHKMVAIALPNVEVPAGLTAEIRTYAGLATLATSTVGLTSRRAYVTASEGQYGLFVADVAPCMRAVAPLRSSR